MNRRNRILVLDSSEQVLIETERLLEGEGIETTTTWDPSEALELARSRHFDLFLVGEHVPEINAIEILRELQSSRINLQCVVMQRGRMRFDPEFYYSLGAAGVVAGDDLGEISRWVQERLALRKAAVAAG